MAYTRKANRSYIGSACNRWQKWWVTRCWSSWWSIVTIGCGRCNIHCSSQPGRSGILLAQKTISLLLKLNPIGRWRLPLHTWCVINFTEHRGPVRRHWGRDLLIYPITRWFYTSIAFCLNLAVVHERILTTAIELFSFGWALKETKSSFASSAAEAHVTPAAPSTSSADLGSCIIISLRLRHGKVHSLTINLNGVIISPVRARWCWKCIH